MQDAELLREYVTSGSDTAFAELVERYVDFVYSTARRQLGNAQLAEEAAQIVFSLLARKAVGLVDLPSLAGWLCRSARNISLNFRRDEFRRHSRERQAMEHLDSIPDTAPDWERLRPVLDDSQHRSNKPHTKR